MKRREPNKEMVMIKREYRCFFEGLQEEMYFEHIAKKIREIKPESSVKFRQVSKLSTLDKSSTNVLKLAVFDYDLNKIEFEKRVKMCKETRILYSNLNFDLWLLLHKRQFRKNVQSNNAYVSLIREEYGLSSDTNIKTKNNIQKILNQINLEDVKNAIKNADEIMNEKLKKDEIYVNNSFSYYANPSMSIHNFFKDLIKDLDIN